VDTEALAVAGSKFRTRFHPSVCNELDSKTTMKMALEDDLASTDDEESDDKLTGLLRVQPPKRRSFVDECKQSFLPYM
jgi:hypothetical protein